MLLGVDVGGTYTDAVLVDNGMIVTQAKVKTTQDEVLRGILQALDIVLSNNAPEAITRVVVSSTIVTNALTEGKTEPVFLAVMAGPGMSTKGMFPTDPYSAGGYVDHRGQIITVVSVDERLVTAMSRNMKIAAVSGKFAVRSQRNEQELRAKLKTMGFKKIFMGFFYFYSSGN